MFLNFIPKKVVWFSHIFSHEVLFELVFCLSQGSDIAPNQYNILPTYTILRTMPEVVR